MLEAVIMSVTKQQMNCEKAFMPTGAVLEISLKNDAEPYILYPLERSDTTFWVTRRIHYTA